MDSAYEFALISAAIMGVIGVFNGIGLFRTYKRLKAGAADMRTKLTLTFQSLAQIVTVGVLFAIAYVTWFHRTNDIRYEEIMRGGGSDSNQTEEHLNPGPTDKLRPEH